MVWAHLTLILVGIVSVSLHAFIRHHVGQSASTQINRKTSTIKSHSRFTDMLIESPAVLGV